jgi:predicted regulator of amino acid metabolism with ACT domain
VSKTVGDIRCDAESNTHREGGIDRKIELIEKEEKTIEEEDELDKLFLQNICSEIMEEVMDFAGDQVVLPSNTKSRAKRVVKEIRATRRIK